MTKAWPGLGPRGTARSRSISPGSRARRRSDRGLPWEKAVGARLPAPSHPDLRNSGATPARPHRPGRPRAHSGILIGSFPLASRREAEGQCKNPGLLLPDFRATSILDVLGRDFPNAPQTSPRGNLPWGTEGDGTGPGGEDTYRPRSTPIELGP